MRAGWRNVISIVVALIIGTIVALISKVVFREFLVGTQIDVGLMTSVIRSWLPAFIGAFIVGYMVRKWGWVYGVVTAWLFETSYAILHIHMAPFHYSVEAMLNVYISVWIEFWWLMLGSLMFGAAGGFLGAVLAQFGQRGWNKD